MENDSDGTSGRSAGSALLEGLNPAQLEAVTTEAAPLCILAGAGSGKTRVLTRRIAHRILYGGVDAARVLALTFTRKAAGEMSSRLGALGVRDRVAVGTFHSVAFAQLRQYWADTGQRAPELAQSKIRLLAPLLSRYGGLRNLQPADIASEIEWAKARLLSPDAYAAEITRIGRKPPLGVDPMSDLYRRYEAEKRRKGVVDFDDLLSRCVEAIEADKEFATRQRWRFRHLFVDEFQDVNPAQHRLLEGWRGSSSDLCVVGDPNQAIYAWNGADPRFLTEFARRNPGARVVRLDDNYRSTPQILTVADAVLGLGSRTSPALRANRSRGSLPEIATYASDIEEARGVARELRQRHSAQVGWRNMAVLMRTNAQALLFEEAFRAAGIPCRVRGEGAFLGQPEVKRALGELRRGPSNVPIASKISDLDDMVAEIAATGATGAEGTNERLGQLEGLVRLAHEYAGTDAAGTVSGFLQWLQATITNRSDEPDRGGDLVEITTFHRAKGLEWQVVFLTGLERGFVPIGQADNEDAWDEERRLLYVAVTRAEQELVCSWAQQRTFGSRTTGRNPSPWIANIEAAIAAERTAAERGDSTASVDWRSVLRTQREQLEHAKRAGVPGIRGTKGERVQVGTKADPALLEALKDWRKRAARATGVPAFVICHDTTLAAVAEARPRNRVQLMALPGMGPVKVDRFGDQLLEVVARAHAS